MNLSRILNMKFGNNEKDHPNGWSLREETIAQQINAD